MRKLSNTEAELKKNVVFLKKACNHLRKNLHLRNLTELWIDLSRATNVVC